MAIYDTYADRKLTKEDHDILYAFVYGYALCYEEKLYHTKKDGEIKFFKTGDLRSDLLEINQCFTSFFHDTVDQVYNFQYEGNCLESAFFDDSENGDAGITNEAWKIIKDAFYDALLVHLPGLLGVHMEFLPDDADSYLRFEILTYEDYCNYLRYNTHN